MSFEIELLNERLDVREESIWHVVSTYWEATQRSPFLSAFSLKSQDITDIRAIQKWHGDYEGIELEIVFAKDGDKLIWIGVTYIGDGPFSDHEHVLGYIEVRRIRISSDVPTEVRVVCCWKPFYLFFKGLADILSSHFIKHPLAQAMTEILDFKSFVERQTFRDIFVNGKAQENIARALLQTALIRRSYREVPVRGGQSDILVFDRYGRMLYETKIWRGPSYFLQGLREIEEYIAGEDSDGQLSSAFYILFDDTKSAAARRYRGSDITTEVVANRTVNVVVINIRPPSPSRKPKS